ncbi:MAG: hypothetical protein WBZ36_30960 [Candidatus Nitrosopolaris sp.]
MTSRLGRDVCGKTHENLPYPSRNYRGLCDQCRNLDLKGRRILSLQINRDRSLTDVALTIRHLLEKNLVTTYDA